MRSLLGVLVRDLPRYVHSLTNGSRDYLRLSNYAERVTAAPFGAVGHRCEWRWTSDLHAAKVVPALGRWLLRRALADHPIDLADAPAETAQTPQVTFVIGHRGSERNRLLELTLMSIAAQRGAAVEAVVVEQAPGPSEVVLPAWVHHVVTPSRGGAPYNRAWAFNVGARVAKGRIIVLHDGDMLAPADYASCILAHVHAGSDVVELKRFIFYLSERDTDTVCRARQLSEATPKRIVQNSLGGGSVAITAAAYARLGGMDEGFVGWGGEDSEFWERCGLLSRWDYAYLPIIHLWHRDQPKKEHIDNPTVDRYRKLARLLPADRVRRLTGVPRGGFLPREDDPFADILSVP
jgi:glycosyl transferase family 7 (putative galactosyltransferase)